MEKLGPSLDQKRALKWLDLFEGDLPFSFPNPKSEISFFISFLPLILYPGILSGQQFYFISNETLSLYLIDSKNCAYEEVTTLKFPPGVDHAITAMVFHPNGKVYVIDSKSLYELDLDSGQLTFIFNPGPETNFIRWLGMTIDSSNQIIMGYSNLNYYDPVEKRYSEKPGTLILDNFTIYRNNILAGHLENFEYVDIHRTPYSLIDGFILPGLSEMTAMTTYNSYCEGEIIYGFNHNLEHNTHLFTIDPSTHMFDTLCTIDVNFVIAMGSPFLYYNPDIQPDFDIDNSSGHTGNGFFAKWNCQGRTSLTDDDIGLRTCKKIDSIIVESKDVIVFSDHLEQITNGMYRWVNSNGEDTVAIKNWLREVTLSIEDTQEEKIIKTYFFGDSEVADIWTIIEPRTDIFENDSVSISFCQNENAIDLDSVLDFNGEMVYFEPGLIGHIFEPARDPAGVYRAIRTNKDCQDTTFIEVNIITPPQNWILDPLSICYTDNIVIDPNFQDFTFQWLDSLGTEVIVPGTYHYQISNDQCRWENTVEVKIDPNCFCQIYVPNSFTPNGDGINDAFEMYADDCIQVKSAKIFDRWGNLLYSSSAAVRWFGDNHASGVYIYAIEYLDQRSNITIRKNGDVLLIR
ncbi:MAG: gliding motility-associated C-terminal domain-containing protein [Saprospiraceae bacterium]|nr:gliding motility-associated C-terminal domain-containing protein [Saprospiraceae bacterium]